MYNFMAFYPFERHISGGGPSIYGSFRGPFPWSHSQWARKSLARLEKYACLSCWDIVSA